MPAQWTGEIVGQIHSHGLKQKEIAEKLGCSKEWVSKILNGHRSPKGAEERFRKALEELIAERRT